MREKDVADVILRTSFNGKKKINDTISDTSYYFKENIFIYFKTCLEGTFKFLSSDYSRLHSSLSSVCHKSKFLSFYNVDSSLMLLFSHLHSCLV